MPRPRHTCPSCGERVLWAVTQDGERALNPVPNPSGGWLAYKDTALVWRARVNRLDQLGHPAEKPYQDHALTCTGPGGLDE